MKTITIITPANIEIEYRLAGAGSRLAAFAVDLLIQLVFCLILGLIVLFIEGLGVDSIFALSGSALTFLIITYFTLYFGYFLLCEMLMNGQSIGKKMFALRVIRDNGQAIGLVQSLIRNLFRTVLDTLYVGLFSILFSKKNKRFGDMAAGTVVVAEYPNPPDSLTLPSAESPNRAVQRFSHIQLSEDERYLLKSYIRRQESLPDEGEALRKRFIEYFAQKWGIEPDLLDESVLRYLAVL